MFLNDFERFWTFFKNKTNQQSRELFFENIFKHFEDVKYVKYVENQRDCQQNVSKPNKPNKFSLHQSSRCNLLCNLMNSSLQTFLLAALCPTISLHTRAELP